MEVFYFEDYRSALRASVQDRKEIDPKFGFHTLAEAARIQRPYMSKVLTGSAQLNSDQMYLICQCLSFREDALEYMQLLLAFDRTSLPDRKAKYREKIESICTKYKDSAKHLKAKVIDSSAAQTKDLSEYYLDPYLQLIHVALSIEMFSADPSKLSVPLGLPLAQLRTSLETLKRLDLVTQVGGKSLAHEPKIHLSKNSQLYRSWQNQLRNLAQHKLNILPTSDFTSFSTVFSSDLATHKKIQEKFFEFLKFVEDEVTKAPAKQMFQLNFDLFPWTREISTR